MATYSYEIHLVLSLKISCYTLLKRSSFGVLSTTAPLFISSACLIDKTLTSSSGRLLAVAARPKVLVYRLKPWNTIRDEVEQNGTILENKFKPVLIVRHQSC